MFVCSVILKIGWNNGIAFLPGLYCVQQLRNVHRYDVLVYMYAQVHGMCCDVS